MDKFMQMAIEEAKTGLAEGGIPIGAVLVSPSGEVLGRGHNQRVQKQDPIIHAEIDALRQAGRVGRYRGCTIYSTLMPCYLCSGAIVQFGISKVIAGEDETFQGGQEFMASHGVEVVNLDLAECKEMLQQFIARNPELWAEDIGELD